MSRFSAFLDGVGFRTNTPEFRPGDEITSFVTGTENGHAVVRIGDTILRLDGAPEDPVDLKIRLRVDDFDGNDHSGTATYLETVGQSSF